MHLFRKLASKVGVRNMEVKLKSRRALTQLISSGLGKSSQVKKQNSNSQWELLESEELNIEDISTKGELSFESNDRLNPIPARKLFDDRRNTNTNQAWKEEIVEVITEPDPPIIFHPGNKSTNNLFRPIITEIPGSSLPCNDLSLTSTKEKLRVDKKMGHYEEESIEEIFQVPEFNTLSASSTLPPTTTALALPVPFPTKKKLQRKLSMKNFKKTGKRIRKVLKTGFVSMGHSMMHLSLTAPSAYEFVSIYETEVYYSDYEKRQYEQFLNSQDYKIYTHIDTCSRFR